MMLRNAFKEGELSFDTAVNVSSLDFEPVEDLTLVAIE
jgi:hypothetical protein